MFLGLLWHKQSGSDLFSISRPHLQSMLRAPCLSLWSDLDQLQLLWCSPAPRIHNKQPLWAKRWLSGNPSERSDFPTLMVSHLGGESAGPGSGNSLHKTSSQNQNQWLLISKPGPGSESHFLLPRSYGCSWAAAMVTLCKVGGSLLSANHTLVCVSCWSPATLIWTLIFRSSWWPQSPEFRSIFGSAGQQLESWGPWMTQSVHSIHEKGTCSHRCRNLTLLFVGSWLQITPWDCSAATATQSMQTFHMRPRPIQRSTMCSGNCAVMFKNCMISDSLGLLLTRDRSGLGVLVETWNSRTRRLHPSDLSNVNKEVEKSAFSLLGLAPKETQNPFISMLQCPTLHQK